jgi:hypothetical protein
MKNKQKGKIMPEYEVTLTLKMLIEAGNEFAAEAEAIDLVHMFPATVTAKATKSKISKYMKS